MYSIVKRLRVDGTRKADRDILSDPGTIGHLTVVVVDGVAVASVYAVGSAGRRDPLIPMLFRAKLVTMHNDRMLFRGFERHPHEHIDRDENRQEWAVRVMVDQPHVPAPSERLG